jgi:hypothetical protein
MFEVRRRQSLRSATSAKQAPTHTASQAQARGYARLLSVSKSINRASESSRNLYNGYIYWTL